MQYIALTGILPHVLKELQENYIRTIEIRSPHNFVSVNAMDVGDLIFLTKTSYSDITGGTFGIIARVTQRQIAIHRIMQRTDEISEECETFAARLQLELQGLGRVRKIEKIVVGRPIVVDADRVTYLEGR